MCTLFRLIFIGLQNVGVISAHPVFIAPNVGELLTQKFILVALTYVPYMTVSTLFHYHMVSTLYSGFVVDVKMFDGIGVFIVLVTPDDPRLKIRSWITQESLKICC